jgi:hypothetical protein
MRPTKESFSLRLFYHYLRETGPNFPQSHNAALREIWAVDVPQLAFESDYLLHGHLTVSALHLHLALAPDDATILKASRIYFDLCIEAFQNELVHQDRTNQNALSLPVPCSSCSRSLFPGQATEREPYQPPMFAMDLTKALETLRAKTRRRLEESNIGTFIARDVPKSSS